MAGELRRMTASVSDSALNSIRRGREEFDKFARITGE